MICDCKPLTRLDLNKTDQQLKIITGVVETGLFLGGKKTVLVSDGNVVECFPCDLFLLIHSDTLSLLNVLKGDVVGLGSGTTASQFIKLL